MQPNKPASACPGDGHSNATVAAGALGPPPGAGIPATLAPAPWQMIYLARRNPALAAEDFAQAWREHSALGRQCRNVQEKVLGVTQCTRLRTDGEQRSAEDGGLHGASTEYDGVNLLQLRDLCVASDIWNDPETLAIMRPDEPRVFSTYVRDFTLVCRARVLREAPATQVALFGFVRRAAGTSRAAFDAAWGGGPAAAWLDAPALHSAVRVLQHSVVQTPPPGCDYDGIAEWWFADAAAARAAFASHASAGAADLRAQLPAVFGAVVDLQRSVFMFTGVTHRRP